MELGRVRVRLNFLRFHAVFRSLLSFPLTAILAQGNLRSATFFPFCGFSWALFNNFCSLLFFVPFFQVMSNTVDIIRVEKFFSQLVRADKLSRLDRQSYRVKNASQ